MENCNAVLEAVVPGRVPLGEDDECCSVLIESDGASGGLIVEAVVARSDDDMIRHRIVTRRFGSRQEFDILSHERTYA